MSAADARLGTQPAGGGCIPRRTPGSAPAMPDSRRRGRPGTTNRRRCSRWDSAGSPRSDGNRDSDNTTSRLAPSKPDPGFSRAFLSRIARAGSTRPGPRLTPIPPRARHFFAWSTMFFEFANAAARLCDPAGLPMNFGLGCFGVAAITHLLARSRSDHRVSCQLGRGSGPSCHDGRGSRCASGTRTEPWSARLRTFAVVLA